MAVVEVINRGTAKDLRLQQLLRIFTFLCAMGQFEVVAYHLMGIPEQSTRYFIKNAY